MLELTDYNRPYKTDLKLEDFSKEGLIKLLQLYRKLYVAVDGFWYLSVKEKISDEQALVCDLWVWERASRYVMKHLTEAMNIRGDDVATFMKIVQVHPYYGNLEHLIELTNENHGVFTVTKCAILEALEREGGERIKHICRGVEPIIFKQVINYVNPAMEVKALKLPPRQSQEDMCCQWEFSLEGK